jgi:transposase InsO family protein
MKENVSRAKNLPQFLDARSKRAGVAGHLAMRYRNLLDARAKIRAWRDEYNGERPHSSLGYRTPNEFAAVLKSSL